MRATLIPPQSWPWKQTPPASRRVGNSFFACFMSIPPFLLVFDSLTQIYRATDARCIAVLNQSGPQACRTARSGCCTGVAVRLTLRRIRRSQASCSMRFPVESADTSRHRMNRRRSNHPAAVSIALHTDRSHNRTGTRQSASVPWSCDHTPGRSTSSRLQCRGSQAYSKQ